MRQQLTRPRHLPVLLAVLGAVLAVGGIGLAGTQMVRTEALAGRPAPTDGPAPSPSTPPEDGFVCPVGEPSAPPVSNGFGYAPVVARFADEVVAEFTFSVSVDAQGKVTMSPVFADKPYLAPEVSWAVGTDEVVKSCIKLYFDSRTAIAVMSATITNDDGTTGPRIITLPKAEQKDRDGIAFGRFPFSISPNEVNRKYNVVIKVKFPRP